MTAQAAPARGPARLPLPSGWPLTLYATIATATVCSFLFTLSGGDVEGWRMVIRTTARTSLAFFLLAFIASSLRALWRTRGTAWLLANRRYLGVSFAASHALHLLAIVRVSRLSPDFHFDPTTVIAGGLAYLFLAALTATSFDRTTAWLGARRWKVLHKTGMYYLWFVFAATYGPRAAGEPSSYGAFVLLLATALGLRVAAGVRRTRYE